VGSRRFGFSSVWLSSFSDKVGEVLLRALVPFVSAAIGLTAASSLVQCKSSSSAPSPPASDGPDCPNKNPLGNLYWGDLHVHTSFSFDAFLGGNRSDPAAAYAFAKGKTQIPIAAADPSTINATIDRPLDFNAVTDHSEFLSVTGECYVEETMFGQKPFCQSFNKVGTPDQQGLFLGLGLQLVAPHPSQPTLCNGSAQDSQDCVTGETEAWHRVQQAAADAYDRCSFTTLVAYEWTAQTGGVNLHRNVVFGTDKVPSLPESYLDYPTPLELWRALERDCKKEDGCDVITIPHNSNASDGKMWNDVQDPEAIPYMERYQTLVEMYQHKGNSECLPGDALSDPECAFEQLTSNFIQQIAGVPPQPITHGGPGMVRNGLAQGLELQASTGQNPLALGIVGATDTHNATPGNVKEDTWPGHVGLKDDTPAGRLSLPDFGPGGITGVWAPQNTRTEIFAALKRRETFATSGPRIAVRFYASTAIASDADAQAACDDPGFPAVLVSKGGMPMGSMLKSGGAPYLFVAAMQDATPLDAIDVIKLSSDGTAAAQAIHHVDLADASRAHACIFWRDPDFDAKRATLYYARVFEQPTWRWSHYACQSVDAGAGAGDAGDGGASCATDAGTPNDVKIRERAWTSPLWFTP
jgi:hypothetical protein